MTIEDCKNLLVKKIEFTGGIRFDELVASTDLYSQKGFSEIYHPDMVRQLVAESRIIEIKYSLPGQKNVSYLVPKGSRVTIDNLYGTL